MTTFEAQSPSTTVTVINVISYGYPRPLYDTWLINYLIIIRLYIKKKVSSFSNFFFIFRIMYNKHKQVPLKNYYSIRQSLIISMFIIQLCEKNKDKELLFYMPIISDFFLKFLLSLESLFYP